MTEYEVQPGDTLSAIANKYKTGVRSIMSANPRIKSANSIRVGQVIQIPTSAAAAKKAPAEQPTKVEKHTVARGESLGVIAKKYGSSVAAILKANPDITDLNKIHPGQVIEIPSAATGLKSNPVALKTLAGVTSAYMNLFKGKNINAICDTGYTDAKTNHCAHFVSHALGIETGMVCGSMKWVTRGTGASIRVNEVYNRCTKKGAWKDKPETVKTCLVFVTQSGNMSKAGVMGTHPKKHIGVYIDGTIWHYSNGKDKVVTDTPKTFDARFKGVYGKTATMYYGSGVTCTTDNKKVKTKLSKPDEAKKP